MHNKINLKKYFASEIRFKQNLHTVIKQYFAGGCHAVNIIIITQYLFNINFIVDRVLIR